MLLGDGGFLVYSDATIKIKELSEEERLSLGIKEYINPSPEIIKIKKAHEKEKGVVIKIKRYTYKKSGRAKTRSRKKASRSKESGRRANCGKCH
jgi:hypothetical protein